MKPIIKKKKISRTRHILKAITYRIYSSCITAVIASLITGNVSLSITIGTADFFIKIFTYHIHERVWYAIPFGVEKEKNK